MDIHALRIVGAVIAAIVIVGCAQEPTGLREPVSTVPNFTGEQLRPGAFHSDTLSGTWWIASFFFTTCEDVCPVLTARVAALQRTYGDRVRFVSITVDPDMDDLEAIKEFASGYKADLDRWTFVRMPYDSVRQLALRGFLVVDPKEPGLHTSRLILVDPQQRVREYFDGMDVKEIERLERVLEQLEPLKERAGA